MTKLRTLCATAIGFVVAASACENYVDTDAGDAPGIDAQVPPPTCNRDQVKPAAGYNKDPVWTSAQQMACSTACGTVPANESEQCVKDNCPDYDKFNACSNSVLLNCLTSSGAACRGPWETYVCCSEANDCGGAETQEAFDACIESNCQDRIDAVGACVDETIDPTAQEPHPCITEVANRCIKADTNLDAGAEDDAGADGGTSTKSLGLVDPALRRLRGASLRTIAIAR